MTMIQEYKDIIVAIAAFVGMALGIVNLWRSIHESQVRVSVILEASMDDGEPVIKVVNHSRFDLSISDVGLITDAGQLEQIRFLNDFAGSDKLPKRIESMSETIFDVQVGWRVLEKRGMFQPFAHTSTGKLIAGNDARPFLKRWRQRVKAKMSPNPFSNI